MIARLHKAMAKKEQGFTLIELLVVVIIIGILAAIAIPVFLNQRKSAVDAGIKSDLRSVANEVETGFVNKQAYPASADSVVATGNATITIDGKVVSISDAGTVVKYTNDADGTYTITGVNKDNGTNTVYTYDSAAGGLDDGKPGS